MLNGSTKNHMAANAYAMRNNEALIRYLHQCLFSPKKRTLVKAIENKKLTTWLGLTAADFHKHIPGSSTATNKGHMKRQHKGICSTTKIPESKTHKERIKEALEKIETERDIRHQKKMRKTTRSYVITE